MIEDSVWTRYNDEERHALKKAIALLGSTGILMHQVDLESERLIDGDADQDEKELTKAILRHRAVTQGLRLLHYYGLQLTQDFEKEL